jgi:hypothetical protein
MAAIDAATPRFAAFMARLRSSIASTSSPVRTSVRIASGATRNRCHVFLRDGTAHHRDKLHPTPSEREAWGRAARPATPM